MVPTSGFDPPSWNRCLIELFSGSCTEALSAGELGREYNNFEATKDPLRWHSVLTPSPYHAPCTRDTERDRSGLWFWVASRSVGEMVTWTGNYPWCVKCPGCGWGGGVRGKASQRKAVALLNRSPGPLLSSRVSVLLSRTPGHHSRSRCCCLPSPVLQCANSQWESLSLLTLRVWIRKGVNVPC